MAGEKILRIKAVAETGQVTDELKGLVGGLSAVGKAAYDAAGKSKTEWAALGKELSALGVDDVAEKMNRLADVSDKLGKAMASGNMGQVQKLLEQQGMALSDLRTKYLEVEAVAPKMAEDLKTFLTVGEAGFEAGKQKLVGYQAELEKVRQNIAGVGNEGKKSFSEAATATERLDAALLKIAQADGPRGLARAAGQAEVALEDLEIEVKKSGDATGMLGQKMSDARAKIDQAAISVSRQSDATADLRKKGMATADQFDALRGSAGSLDGMFGRMRDTSTGLGKAVGNVGVGLGLAGMAIQGAIATGKQLSEWIDEGAAKWDRYVVKTQEAAIKSQMVTQANTAVSRGLIEQGTTVDETVKKYVEFTVAQGKLSEQARRYIEVIAGLKVPPSLSELSAKTEATTLALQGALKRGEAAAVSFYTENEGAIKKTIQEYSDASGKIPASLVQISKAIEDMTAKARGRFDETSRALDGIARAGVSTSKAQDDLGKSVVDIGKKYRDTIADIEAEKTAHLNAINEKLAALDREGNREDDYGKRRAAIQRGIISIMLESNGKEAEAKHQLALEIDAVAAATGKEGAAIATAVRGYVDKEARTESAILGDGRLAEVIDTLSGAMKKSGTEAAEKMAEGLTKPEVSMRGLTGAVAGLDAALHETATRTGPIVIKGMGDMADKVDQIAIRLATSGPNTANALWRPWDEGTKKASGIVDSFIVEIEKKLQAQNRIISDLGAGLGNIVSKAGDAEKALDRVTQKGGKL